MGMADTAKNIKRTMEDIRKPQLYVPSKMSPSLPPWAWKASLFFWRRLVKKNPPKPHVIKPSSTSSLQVRPSSCRRAKSGPVATNHHTKYACNSKNFYYSYPDPDHDYVNAAYMCCDPSRTKGRSGLRRQLRGCTTPTTSEYSPNLLNLEYNKVLPYFQLHRSSQKRPSSSAARLPLYIVS